MLRGQGRAYPLDFRITEKNVYPMHSIFSIFLSELLYCSHESAVVYNSLVEAMWKQGNVICVCCRGYSSACKL
jgi:leucyl-tRNA synthetase